MLSSPTIRTHALDLAKSAAWNELVRPEIDRQLADYETSILDSEKLSDRELADQRTRYHALKKLLTELNTTVMGSLTSMSSEERAVFSPEMRAQLSSLFSPQGAGLGKSRLSSGPAAPPPPPPIEYPATPTFNPFASPPPAVDGQ